MVTRESLRLGTRVHSAKYGLGSITEIQNYTAWEAKRGHCKLTVHFDGGVERSYDLAIVQRTGLLSLPGESPALMRGIRRKKEPRGARGFPAQCYDHAEIVPGGAVVTSTRDDAAPGDEVDDDSAIEGDD